MSVPDLILRTRLDVLRRNLEEVAKVIDTVEDHREMLRHVVAVPRDPKLMAAVATIDKHVVDARGGLALRNDATVEQSLTGIAAAVADVRSVLERARRDAANIETRWLELTSGELHKTLSDLLVASAGNQVKALDRIRTEKLDPARASNDADEARALAGAAWREYHDEVRKDVEEVFHEYVDMLGGLALRETGFDHGICNVADELLGQVNPTGTRWGSMTVPGHEETLNATMAWIVRLGFPEWTVWALPLAAHELGHVVLPKTEMQAYLDREQPLDRVAPLESAERRELRILLADAFATCVMGPAYACSVILIRLNPINAFATSDDGARPALAARRAGVTLRALEHLNAQGDEKPWGGIVKRLREEWDEALAQAGLTGRSKDAETPDMEGIVSVASSAAGPGLRFPAKRWQRIGEWAEHLSAGTTDQLQPRFDDELRFVLNATWLSRLESPAGRSVDKIAEEALEFWNAIVDQQSGTGRGAGWRRGRGS